MTFILAKSLALAHCISLRASRHFMGSATRATATASAATTIADSAAPAQLEPPHIKAIVEQISQLKFYEVTLLNEALKRELKIPDVQTMVAANVSPAGGGADPDETTATAVKSSYSVKLTKFDESKKISLIKEIKKLVEGLNLVEAKRFVEECPRVIRSNMTKEEAETLQKQLEAAGGIVELE